MRGWPLRLLAVLVAVASAATAYLAISLWVIPDVAVRGGGSGRGPGWRTWSAPSGTTAARCSPWSAAVLRPARRGAVDALGAHGQASTAKYAAPGAIRGAQQPAEPPLDEGTMSERMIWDALDEGQDPTDRRPESDTGRLTGSVTVRGGYPSRMEMRGTLASGQGKGTTGMSSVTVLDSIIEGVRADVAAREAVVSMAAIRAAGREPRRRRWM